MRTKHDNWSVGSQTARVFPFHSVEQEPQSTFVEPREALTLANLQLWLTWATTLGGIKHLMYCQYVISRLSQTAHSGNQIQMYLLFKNFSDALHDPELGTGQLLWLLFLSVEVLTSVCSVGAFSVFPPAVWCRGALRASSQRQSPCLTQAQGDPVNSSVEQLMGWQREPP